MPLELFISSSLAGVEKLLNQALALDNANLKKIQRLDGKRISIKSSAPTGQITITIYQQGFLLSPVIDDEVDATISGKSSSLLNLLLARDKAQAIRENKIQIQGDAGIIQELQQVLSALEIDWEFHLSKLIGDIPTQMLSDGLTHLRTFIGSSHDRLYTNLDEYLHEESALLPGKNELEAFYQRIDELRLRLDRSNTRLNKLLT